MTDTRMVDHATGEIVTADDAWERHRRIVGLRDEIERNGLRLGEELWLFDVHEQYLTMGYSSFKTYCADPEVDIGYRTAAKLKGIFETFRISLGVQHAALVAKCEKVGTDKLEIIRPYVDEANVDEWLNKAAALSRSDLRREVHETFAPAPVVTPEFPDGKYRCIVIDPPWPMKKIERTLYPNQGYHLDYATMTLDEIGALPVGDMADDLGCHLYLWVTQKYLPAGLQMVEQWGFNYQCLMTWVKPTGFTPYSWMYNTEHVIFARRGNLPLLQMGLKLAFDAPKNGHSAKPDIFYQRVLDASPEPRLEMFARRQCDGFTVWGNEV